MFEVRKCGKTDFGYWAIGSLKYKGFEIQDLFSVNKELKDGETYQPKSIELKRNKNNQLRFKLYL